jgi:hypothetical protein
LAAALGTLEARFREWHAGDLDVHQLSDAIHQFHDGIARDLHVVYTRGDPRSTLAQAVARKVLHENEASVDLIEALRQQIIYYEKSDV